MIEAMERSDGEVSESALNYYRKLMPLAYSQGPFAVFGPIKKLIFWLLALRKPMPRGPRWQSGYAGLGSQVDGIGVPESDVVAESFWI